ncbi:single-stranded DNA-binding protein [Bifidobacterium callitrichidarum]|uniref:Single-stranded DNA-binding protein n=1 Tax=Bifidobacterium callitrichidarum TaxID=2052941 RepID=A0A2U2NCD1_9BIFI|nr:single-stranded DNA-binding protein [Bifidobacterium callitrichidarum]PWG66659.1 single-stranded DNA-binding protein [Bifidobacterium callitrichidarum]
MADETPITITGNLTSDPEVRTNQNGPIVTFTVAHQTRVFDRQAGQYGGGKTSFYRCTAFRSLAQNIASAMWRKGQRVIVTGYIEQHQWQAEDGTSRSTFQVIVQDAGLSLLFAGGKDTSTYGNHAAPGNYANTNAAPAQFPQAGGASQQPQQAASNGVYDPWNGNGSNNAGASSGFGSGADFGSVNQGV